MATYFARLKSIWDELINYEQIPVCNCKGVTAELMKRYEKQCKILGLGLTLPKGTSKREDCPTLQEK